MVFIGELVLFDKASIDHHWYVIILIYKFCSEWKVNGGPKPHLEELHLKLWQRPRLGAPSKAGIPFSLLRNHASQGRRPRSRPRVPRPPAGPGERKPANARAPGRGPTRRRSGRTPPTRLPGGLARALGAVRTRGGRRGGGRRRHRPAPRPAPRTATQRGAHVPSPPSAAQRPGRSSPRGPARRRQLLQPPGAAAPDTLQPLAHHRPLGAALALPQ